MSAKHSAGPWHVYYRQIGQGSRKSRPVIQDAHGRTVGSKAADAELMAAAPALAALLEKLTDLAEMQALQIASALELSCYQKHPCIREARALLDAVRRKGVYA